MSNTATGNIYKQLRALVNDNITTVGVSQGPNGDGTTNVVLVGSGDEVTVSGTGFSFGTSVFITNGTITGEAPTLSPVVVDV